MAQKDVKEHEELTARLDVGTHHNFLRIGIRIYSRYINTFFTPFHSDSFNALNLSLEVGGACHGAGSQGCH